MKRILLILLFLPLFTNGQMLINSYRYASGGGGGGGGPTMPTSNMRYYFSSDVGVTTSGSDVTAWDDRSTNNRDRSQSSSGARPNLVSSSIVFNGTSDYLNVSYTASQVVNYYIVLEFDAAGAVAIAGDIETIYVGRESDDKISISTNFGGDVFKSTATAPAENTKYLLHIVMNNASSSITINNGSASTGNINYSGSLTNPWTLGAVTFSGSPIVYGAITIYEEVKFGSQTSGEIADVKTVLNTKHSIW